MGWIVKDICDHMICHFPQILHFFFKNRQKHGEGIVLAKNKCRIWTVHSQVLLWRPISRLYLRKKVFGTCKTVRTHSFGHVTLKSSWGIKLVFLGSLFHWPYQSSTIFSESKQIHLLCLQRVVRGHITRKKLHEARELYNSIVADLDSEEGNNFTVCLITQSTLHLICLGTL